MSDLNKSSTEVVVKYQTRDGYHVFTSESIMGLYIASENLKDAFDDVPRVISMLMKLDYGIDCEVRLKVTYDEFIERHPYISEAREMLESRTRELMNDAKREGLCFTIGPRYSGIGENDTA
ncbi:MAG: hypothetical protein OXC26_22470 [Albidovulum sp.]|nr:hypothetical protein [Albidovulum sp.]